jgi:alpha-mannosidase
MPARPTGTSGAERRSGGVPAPYSGVMHDNRRLVELRIGRETLQRVLPLVHPQRVALEVLAGPSPDELKPFATGTKWGPPWGTTWFEFRGEIPEAWEGRRVEAVLDLGFRADAPGFQCEGLLVDDAGRPVQGIHPRRTNVAVPSTPGPVVLRVEAASNPAFPQFAASPLGSLDTAGNEPLYRLDRADLVVVDSDAAELIADIDVLAGVMHTLDQRDPRRAQLLAALERAFDAVPDVAAARRCLGGLLTVPARGSAHRVTAIGHAHIDTAWLWPIGESVRKCARTFASAVSLMDSDPDYRFACSQAQQYAWIEERHPDLFARIVGKAAAGQWVPVGGMWVEPDMNLPSGESIVRQIVHGQRYFESRFGRRCSEVWIPDVFGYPAGLPQVFAAGGMRRFVTQKLSWNKTNRFPHHTFWWEGLDGTMVLTHFPPVDTYNAELRPDELAHASANFAEHRWSRHSLVPYGHGDGGGGPTREMLARAYRMADLDGVPPVRLGTPDDFFTDVEAEINAGAAVPVWRGELYFETHRGTLTSQLDTKLGNRRCERLLFELELWSAALDRQAGVDHLWREVLTQQFHDILPGSSIAWVHAEAEGVFARVAAELDSRIATALGELAGRDDALANAASRSRREVVILDAASGLADRVGASGQTLSTGDTAVLVDAAPYAVTPLVAVDSDHPVVVTDRSMSNGRLAVRWDQTGALVSVIDVATARELIPSGASAAVLALAPDHPVEYDAWDVEEWTIAAARPLAAAVDDEPVEVVEHGPLLGRVRYRRRFGPSSAAISYTLRAGSPRLDVDVELDWQHDEHLVVIRFPLDVRADTALCDVQFGVVARPTHRSTTWDASKFEVCAHRFVALAEPGFGAAVLNDGRYGHQVLDGAIGVSLARAANFPDPNADRGAHRVTLSLMAFDGDLDGVIAEAERLNRPLRIVPSQPDRDAALPVPTTVVDLTGTGVEIDAVKLADDGSGDLVVRLHEHRGARQQVTLRVPWVIGSAWRCNLLEERDTGFEVSDGVLALTLRPFELATVRLSPRGRE